jgi:transposase
MTKPYSEDLRTRVVAAVVAGASCRDAAQRFSIGVSSVVRWAQRFRRTGSVAAKRRILLGCIGLGSLAGFKTEDHD